MTRHDPDVVLLDIDMPELDGTEALPDAGGEPVAAGRDDVDLTTRNADISSKCLALGAVDYIAKPESNRGVTTSEAFRTDLIERVRVLGRPGPGDVRPRSCPGFGPGLCRRSPPPPRPPQKARGPPRAAPPGPRDEPAPVSC